MEGRNEIKVLDKAIAILRAFSPATPYLTAQELASRLNLNKTTVHRILGVLERSRLVFKDEHRYTLGIGTREFAWSDLWRQELMTFAAGPMRELRDATNEAVGLYVMCSPIEYECILVLDSPLMIRPYERISHPIPLGLGATSRIFLAFELARSGPDGLGTILQALPANTLMLPQTALVAEVEQALDSGVAFMSGERFPDAASIAAPIYDADHNGLSVMALFGPASRLDVERRQQLAPKVKAVANRISALISARRDASYDAARSDEGRGR